MGVRAKISVALSTYYTTIININRQHRVQKMNNKQKITFIGNFQVLFAQSYVLKLETAICIKTMLQKLYGVLEVLL